MLCFIYLPPSLLQVMEMIKQKEKLEEEIRALQEVLSSQNVGEELAIDNLYLCTMYRASIGVKA